jgi:hypothetical protein
MKLIVAAFALVLLTNQASGQSACRKAGSQDHAHGANETIEYSARTLRQINGIVSDPTGAVMTDVVVEAYFYDKSERTRRAPEIAQSKARVAAALTGAKGNFCFRGLRSGRYVLNIGTRQSAGFQEVFIKIRLDPNRRSRSSRFSKRLRIELPLGT